MEKVTGYVGHIVFRNAENGYTVFHLENDDGEVTCVGNFNYITEGELIDKINKLLDSWKFLPLHRYGSA